MENLGQSVVSGDRGRVTEVWCDSASGCFGTGYYLGGGLILTARHVVMPVAATPPTVIKARPLGIAHRVTGLLVADLFWPDMPQLADARLPDAALLRLRDFGDFGDFLGEDVRPRLSPPDDNKSRIHASATGFPAFRSMVDGRRDTEEIAGDVLLGTAMVAGRYEIRT